MAARLGLPAAPRVRIIAQGVPFLAGLRHPTIFLPAPLAGGEGETEILVHEMVHLKRGDLVLRPLERFIADLFWFSPFAWAIRGELDYWREAAVDEETATITGDRIAYARALTRAARHSRPSVSLPVAAFILKKEGTLKMRLETLFTDQRPVRRLGVSAVALIALAAPLALAQGLLIRGPAVVLAAAPVAGETADFPVAGPATGEAAEFPVAATDTESGPPRACAEAFDLLKTLPRPDFWQARLDSSRQANIAAGLGGENLIPKTIVWPQPAYPNEAVNLRLSAGCDVMFDLGTDGLPTNAQAHCTSPHFVEIAESLPNAKFEPAINANGEPTEFKGLIYPLQFCIH